RHRPARVGSAAGTPVHGDLHQKGSLQEPDGARSHSGHHDTRGVGRRGGVRPRQPEKTIGSNNNMNRTFPVIYLARHGETAWTITGQHTGLTDLPLTERGEDMARRLGERLNGTRFAKVFTSPLRRAVRTCELAGFGAMAETDRDL